MKNYPEQRLEICNQCDSFQHTLSLCKECNCFMMIKVFVKRAKCPLGKWGAASKSDPDLEIRDGKRNII